MKNLYTNLPAAHNPSPAVGDSFQCTKKQNLMKKILIPSMTVILAIIMIFIASTAQAFTYYSRASANWAVNSTWSTTGHGGAAATAYPVAGDVVYIGAHTVTVAANAACTSITYDATGGTVSVSSGFTLTLSGALTLNSSASGNMAATITGSGSISCASLAVGNSGQSPSGTRTTIMTSTISSITVSGNLTLTSTYWYSSSTINNPTFTHTSGVVTVNGTIATVNANASNTCYYTMGASSPTLNLGGATPFTESGTGTSTFTLNGTGATVNYNYAGAQTVEEVNYYNLTLANSGAKTLQTGTTTISNDLMLSGTATTTTVVGLTVTGDLIIGNGTTFTAAGYALTITGTTTVGGGTSGNLTISSLTGTKLFTGLVTIAAGGTWTNTAANSPVSFAGGITNNGTFNAGTGAHTFQTNAQALTGTFSIPSVTATSITLTNNNTLTVSTALSGSGGLTQAINATLSIGGTSTITTLTASNTGNTVNYSGAAQTVHSNTYYNLSLSGSGAKTMQTGTTAISNNFTLSGTVSTTLAANVSIGGDLNVGTGTTLDLSTYTANRSASGGILTVAGTLVLGGTSGGQGSSNFPNNFSTLTMTGGTVSYDNASGGQTVYSAPAYNNLTLANTSGTQTAGGNLSIGGVLTTTTGGTLDMATYTLSVTGSPSNSGTIVTQNTSSTPISTGKTWAGTVSYNSSTAAQTVSAGTYNNLTLSGSATYPKTIGSGTSVGATLSITSTKASLTNSTSTNVNTLVLDGVSQVSGTWGSTSSSATNKNDAYFSTGYTGVLNVTSGCSPGYWVGNISTDWNTASNWCGGVIPTSVTDVTIPSGTSFSPSIGSAGGICHDITINSGATLTMGGAYTLDVYGDWANNGTFTRSTSTVDFTGSGAQNINSATAFYNVSTSSTAAVTTAAAVTIGGTLTIGSNTSFATGTTNSWTLTVAGATSVSGTLTLANTGNKTFTGNVTLNSGGAWNETGIAAISYAGNLQNDGTYTSNTGMHTFSGTTKTISGTNEIAIPNLTISGTTTNNGTLTVSTTLAGGSALTNGTNATLNFGGSSITLTTLTTTATGNTFNYNGGVQTYRAGITYYNLTFSGSGTKNPSSTSSTTISNNFVLNGTVTFNYNGVAATNNFTCGGSLTINSGTTFNMQRPCTVTGATDITGTVNWGSTAATARAIALNDNVTLNSGAVWTEPAPSNNGYNNTYTFAGDFTNNATTFTAAGTGIHTFSGTGMTMGGATTTSIPNVTISGTRTNSGTLTVTTALAGAGTLTNDATGTLNYGGSGAIAPTLVATAVGNDVNYTGAVQTVKTTTYYNLTLSGTGNKSMANGNSITGVLNIVSSSSKASLANGAAIAVNSLQFIGSTQVAGSWGSTGSSATNKNDTYFDVATSGILNVGLIPSFSNLTASQTICEGTSSITLSGTLSAAGPVYPAIGETVNVTINTVLQSTTTTTGTGGFTINYNTASIPASGTVYTITYAYPGSYTLAPATNTSTTLTVIAAATAYAGLDANATIGVPFTFSGASASNYTSLLWTKSGGTGTFTGITTLTPTYTPATGDPATITFTLTASGNAPCGDVPDNMVLTINSVPLTASWSTTASSSNWFAPGNWEDGVVPGSVTNITIPGGASNYPTITSNVTCASITIEDGGSFIGTEYLTVTGTSLAERSVPVNTYHFLSSPVVSTTFNDVFPNNQLLIWAQVYDEPTGTWINKTIADALDPGIGYSVWIDPSLGAQTALFSGTFNSTGETETLSLQNTSGDPDQVGWNLLGNPFPSGIDWDNGGWHGGNVDGSVYIWDGAGQVYKSWNGSAGSMTGGVIPPENGFFVKTNTNNSTITIPLTARVHTSLGFYKDAVPNTLQLGITGNSYHDDTYIQFNPEATAGFDAIGDAYKLWGISAVPQVYSIIPGYVLSINSLPSTEANPIVSLGLKVGAEATYTITASGMNSFDPYLPIRLDDLKLGTTQDLRLNNTYSFTAAPGDAENRFNVRFYSAVEVEEPTLANFFVYTEQGKIVVNNAGSYSGIINLYNTAGKLITTVKMQPGIHNIAALPVGMYIVKAITGKTIVSRKVVLF
jgi:hypothetical protein